MKSGEEMESTKRVEVSATDSNVNTLENLQEIVSILLIGVVEP